MTAVIVALLAVAWIWGVVGLFRPIDPKTLPPRAQRRLGGRPS